MRHWRLALAGLTTLTFLATSGCSKSAQPKGEAPAPSTEAGQADPVPAPATDATPRKGVKPHYVKCDPARPEMPCTPDTLPVDIEGKAAQTPKPGVKPHYVKCDPARPDMPCTPDTPLPALEPNKN